jgi:DNA replication protein
MSRLFTGFQTSGEKSIPIPAEFFSDLLPFFENVEEIKLVLYLFWRLARLEMDFPYLTIPNIINDPNVVDLFASADQPQKNIEKNLQKIVDKGIFFRSLTTEGEILLPNTTKGRTALQAIQQGTWRGLEEQDLYLNMGEEKPGLFKLYEMNIGPLTPMIADAIQDAEATYPLEWIEDALRIAVEMNKRNWRYIDAILKRWQEGGRDARGDQKDRQKDERDYTSGEYSDYIDR